MLFVPENVWPMFFHQKAHSDIAVKKRTKNEHRQYTVKMIKSNA